MSNTDTDALVPVAWKCELAQEDGSVRTMFVEQDPDGLRFNDMGEPSPFRVTRLYGPDTIERLTRERDEAQQVCAEAYQVVGILLDDTGQLETEHGTKILDNLSEHRPVHDDVLPWSPADTIECDAIEAAVARERERCAIVCEQIAKRHLQSGRYVSAVADHSVRAGGQVDGAEECARAIRTTKATT
jgi:hypothetical protein